MMRFASIILLSAYCLVSLLGHAGFTALRGAAFEWVSANHSAQLRLKNLFGCQCGCSQNRAEMAVDEGDECPSGCPDECPGGCPDDCVVCHFFSLFKAQATTVAYPHCMSNSVPSMFNCLLLGILSSHSIVRFGQDLVARRHSLRDRMNAVTSI
jgi:hypothetical protein